MPDKDKQVIVRGPRGRHITVHADLAARFPDRYPLIKTAASSTDETAPKTPAKSARKEN